MKERLAQAGELKWFSPSPLVSPCEDKATTETSGNQYFSHPQDVQFRHFRPYIQQVTSFEILFSPLKQVSGFFYNVTNSNVCLAKIADFSKISKKRCHLFLTKLQHFSEQFVSSK